MKDKAIKALNITVGVVFLLWLTTQVVLVIRLWGGWYYSDAANYIRFAQEVVEASSWYPTTSQFYNNLWIANTGYINFLALNLRIFGSFSQVGLIQILLNVILLWGVYRLTCKLTCETVGKLSVILFCILPSNIMNAPAILSDLLCMALIIPSMSIMKRNCAVLFIAGVLMVLGNWVRPIAIIFLPSIVIYAIWVKTKFKYYLAYGAGMAVIYCLILSFTWNSCGYALGGSTTKGTNMIIGCWNGADGGYSQEVFKEGNPGYIENSEHINAVEKDKILTIRSVEWIISNPGKFLKLIPRKLGQLWGADVYSDKVYLSEDEALTMKQRVLFSIPYYLILILAAIGLWINRRAIIGVCGLVLLPIILGSGMHILMYGGLRYHYPMMPSVIFLSALGLYYLIKKKSVLRGMTHQRTDSIGCK